MTQWSAENATNAYLQAIRMGNGENEPNASEFISALTAGTNARLMIQVCADGADSTTLALAAAADQTGGKVICIVSNANELPKSKNILEGSDARVEFVIGSAHDLIGRLYGEADCIVVDCRVNDCEEILKTAKSVARELVLGYNAYSMGLSRCLGFDLHVLPIGRGLLVSRVAWTCKTSRWIVRVDECTGEEHVFRVGRRSLRGKNQRRVLGV